MKKRDYLVIINIIVIIAVFTLVMYLRRNEEATYAKVTCDGQLIGTYTLSEDKIIELETNTIEIKDGSVRMTKADCHDLLCVNQKSISKTGQSIICLPNKVSVEIIDRSSNSNISANAFYFNTYVSITIFDSQDMKIIDDAFITCKNYELICSRTDTSSELYKLNHRLTSGSYFDEQNNLHYPLSDELYDMIDKGLKFGKMTDGAFNIAIAPVTELWDFTSGDGSVPDKADIDKALKYCSLDDITLYDDHSISFKHDENMIDLGGLAKGYIADVLKSELKERGVNSAVIVLGGNIVCIGDKYGNPFKIGIQEPFASEGTAITAVEVEDRSIVSSGIYERYFEENGKIYHHIINPATGYPVENELYGVTVLSDSSLIGDLNSTYVYSLGLNKGLEYAHSNPDIDVILIDSDNKIYH